MYDGDMKKTLSCQESIEAAAALFLLNTEEKGVQSIMTQLPLKEAGIQNERFLLEWYAFVHACVVYALMEHAPASVVVGYVRQTHDMLENKNIVEEKEKQKFIDEVFTQYLKPLTEKQPQLCPRVFLAHCGLQENWSGLTLLTVSMAMVLAATMDTVEQYTMQA